MSDFSSFKSEHNELEPGAMVSNYEIISVMGRGGYGIVYKVKLKKKDQFFALKTEYFDAPKPALMRELNIFRTINSPFFPHVYTHGREGNIRYLVMDLFGKSLLQLRNESKGKTIDPKCLLKYGVEMIRCIQHFHLFGYVHLDIKPSNFLMNKTPGFPLILIDFGLAREYINKETGKPFPEKDTKYFCGTSKYVSPRIHKRKSPAPADDLVSWFYSIVEMWRGKLPWSRIENEDDVYQKKVSLTASDVCSQMPSSFKDIYSYIMSIGYYDTPDYERIISSLNEIYNSMFPGVQTDLIDLFYTVHPDQTRPGVGKSDVVKVQIIQNSNIEETEQKKCMI
jgi:serine/threonine protein kinase